MICPICRKLMRKNEISHDCETCGFRMPFVYRGRRISETEISELLEKQKTDWRGGWARKDTKGTLDGRLVIEGGKLTFEAKTLRVKCPNCKCEIYKNGKKRCCSNCDFSINDTLYGRKMSEDDLEKLLFFGYSDVFDDFVSSRGKYYSGQISMDENLALKMIFC